jgi:hypothetical protein
MEIKTAKNLAAVRKVMKMRGLEMAPAEGTAWAKGPGRPKPGQKAVYAFWPNTDAPETIRGSLVVVWGKEAVSYRIIPD